MRAGEEHTPLWPFSTTKNIEFNAKMSEGFEVAKAKVLLFVPRMLPAVQLISEDLYFKSRKVHLRVSIMH